MGWDFWRDPVGDMTREEWARQHWTMKRGDREQEVVDVERVGSTLYVALHVKDGYPGAPFTTALVVLTQGEPRRSGFGYKQIDETFGPNESSCPARILDRLSPVEQFERHPKAREWAEQWRARCRARLVREAA